MRDPQTETEPFCCAQVEKVFTDGPEDEEKAEGTIGDKEVCQDSNRRVIDTLPGDKAHSLLSYDKKDEAAVVLG